MYRDGRYVAETVSTSTKVDRLDPLQRCQSRSYALAKAQ